MVDSYGVHRHLIGLVEIFFICLKFLILIIEKQSLFSAFINNRLVR